MFFDWSTRSPANTSRIPGINQSAHKQPGIQRLHWHWIGFCSFQTSNRFENDFPGKFQGPSLYDSGVIWCSGQYLICSGQYFYSPDSIWSAPDSIFILRTVSSFNGNHFFITVNKIQQNPLHFQLRHRFSWISAHYLIRHSNFGTQATLSRPNHDQTNTSPVPIHG